jgi:hypothetical protein
MTPRRLLLSLAVMAFSRHAFAEAPTKPPALLVTDVLVKQLEERNAQRDAALDQEAKAFGGERKASVDKANEELVQRREEDRVVVAEFDRDTRRANANRWYQRAIWTGSGGVGLLFVGGLLYVPALSARSRLVAGGLATAHDQMSATSDARAYSGAGSAVAVLGGLSLAAAASLAIVGLVTTRSTRHVPPPAIGVRVQGGKLVW